MRTSGAVQTRVDSEQGRVNVRFPVENHTDADWKPDGPVMLGWQLFDPDTSLFIAEGEWHGLPEAIPSHSVGTVELPVLAPTVPGHYHVYISTLESGGGWSYQKGSPFVLLYIEVLAKQISVHGATLTTLARQRRTRLRAAWRTALLQPLMTIWRNRSLIRAMVQRDVLVRYRGSIGDFLWTFLHPLLLMATYFFVFGIVLRTRFGADTSGSGYVLYFLAGMLPWLAFSEAVGRSPTVIIENGNLVKKLVFPVETLPVNLVLSGLITQVIGTALYITALAFGHGGIPASIAWLPVVLVPQILLTLGIAWTLAALGVFLRDLGQIMGFALTLLFFLTPICYPDTSLPTGVAPVLTKNPIYILVRGYRLILLEGRAPYFPMTAKLWAVSIAAFLIGHALFYKLRKSFADVL